MSTPEVVVACAWYNRADYIRDTVDSLLAQDFDSFEIVIVNDGSTDPRVREILDSYDDPRLRVIHQENTGFTVAIRRAIDASDAPFVAVMGAGDRVKPSKLKKQVIYLRSNSNVSAVGCGHTLVSATTSKKISYVKPITRLTLSSANTLKKKVPFTHGTIVYRRTDLYRAGNYDAFFKNAQDRDLYWRILKVGEIHAINEDLYEKYIFEDGVTFRADMVAHKAFYSQLARHQNRDLIDHYKANPNLIPDMKDITNPAFLKYSVRKFLALIIRREFSIASQWSAIIYQQLKRAYK